MIENEFKVDSSIFAKVICLMIFIGYILGVLNLFISGCKFTLFELIKIIILGLILCIDPYFTFYSLTIKDNLIIRRRLYFLITTRNISDITYINCETDHVKYGLKYTIEIETPEENYSISRNMKNFCRLAGYLLEKYEAGEIRKEAVSSHCKAKLMKYKNLDKERKK